MLSAMAGAAGAAQIPTTSSVLTAAKAAIAQRTGVHLVVTSKSSSTSVVEHVAADLGKATGAETISDGTGTVIIKVTPTYAYLSGNSSGLTKVVGLSAAEVSKLGFRLGLGQSWHQPVHRLGRFDDGFFRRRRLARGQGDQAVRPRRFRKGRVRLEMGDGRYQLRAPKFTNTLTLSAVGATLPVEEVTTAPGGARETVMLSHWGEHVQVTAPPAASTDPLLEALELTTGILPRTGRRTRECGRGPVGGLTRVLSVSAMSGLTMDAR